jgi:hypothetical protein
MGNKGLAVRRISANKIFFEKILLKQHRYVTRLKIEEAIEKF